MGRGNRKDRQAKPGTVLTDIRTGGSSGSPTNVVSRFTDLVVDSPGSIPKRLVTPSDIAAEPTGRYSVSFFVSQERDCEILAEGVVGVRCGRDELAVCLDGIVFGGLRLVLASGGFSRHSVDQTVGVRG